MKARRVKGIDPGAPLADNAQRFVHVRLDELFSFVPRVRDPAEVVALHDMRIAAKRLRYVLEVTAETCFGPYAETAVKRARDLQDLLGELHDCDVQLPRVEGLILELREADSVEAYRLGGHAAPDLDPAHATGTTHATAWRGLETLAIYLKARRALLFDRFIAMLTELEREAFRARLEYAARERPEPAEPAEPLEAIDDGGGGDGAAPGEIHEPAVEAS
jgi:CHAD domain-containing protein